MRSNVSGGASGLVGHLDPVDPVEAKQHRARPALDAGDKVIARPEQQAVGHDLAPARRLAVIAAVIEADDALGEQSLAQGRKHGGIGHRTRANLTGKGLGPDLVFNIEAENAAIGVAQAGADLVAQRVEMRGAIRGLGRFERAGGVFQFGQFVERRRRDKTVKAARGQAKALLAAIIDVVQHAKNIFHHVAHALGRAALHADKIGHFVEGQTLPIARQRARQLENGGGFFQSHVQKPNVPMSEPDVSARYFPFLSRGRQSCTFTTDGRSFNIFVRL